MSRLCKDCKHCVPFERRFLFWRTAVRWDLSNCRLVTVSDSKYGDQFTGAPPGNTHFAFCTNERSYGSCGPEGKNFEPMEESNG